MFCSRTPCGMTSAGYCTICGANGVQPFQAMPQPLPPMGCICPPTSERTCKGVCCPRQPPQIMRNSEERSIKSMVDRFLMWKLPEDFSPDCGISFARFVGEENTPYRQERKPVGTNLFTAAQAEAMVRFMLGMTE